jgi:hypothetical protein
MRATAECIFETASALNKTARLFTGSEVDQLIKKMKLAIDEGQLPSMAVALSLFRTSLRDTEDLAGNTPEAQLIVAAMNLEDAVHGWGRADYVAAHADTVRCRAAINSIIE